MLCVEDCAKSFAARRMVAAPPFRHAGGALDEAAEAVDERGCACEFASIEFMSEVG